jgi:hypothetical protein
MKINFNLCIKLSLMLCVLFYLPSLQAQQVRTIRMFDKALFWDGYAKDTIMKDTPAIGVVRFSTSLFTKRIKAEQLDSIGDSLKMKVLIKASCDNYDRIGYVGLAIVPKNQTTYDRSKVKRMEIARFITPFMNKNLKPDTVPYNYEVSNLVQILKDRKINDSFDFWLELSVFGVPYAANTQVAGCAGRKDVFFGTVDLITNDNEVVRDTDNLVTPLMYNFSFNSYQQGASDSLGVNTKTLKFTLVDSLKDAVFHLITSNHGADSAGEEYNRREHYVYFNNQLVLQYKPGFTTCEPYRKFNTQGNGIYGASPRTEAQWQSFSNWCPGAYIPIRSISLGNLSKGTHEFKLSVPDAQFVKKSGYFPLSLYIQGKKYIAKKTNSIISSEMRELQISPNPVKDKKIKLTNLDVYKDGFIFRIFSMEGKQLFIKQVLNSAPIIELDVHFLEKGIYILTLEGVNSSKSKRIIIE